MFCKWKDRKKGDKEKQSKDTEKNSPKSNKRRMDAFFIWLGKFVTKNYKIILIVGALSAAAAIYPAILLQGELKYNDQDFIPQNLESDISKSLLDEQFPSNISRSSTIIVLDSDEEITSSANLNFINNLTERIEQSRYRTFATNVESIVSVYDFYINSYWDGMNETSDLIYDIILENVTYANATLQGGVLN